eukprot:70021-Rhodomonas_salina.10
MSLGSLVQSEAYAVAYTARLLGTDRGVSGCSNMIFIIMFPVRYVPTRPMRYSVLTYPVVLRLVLRSTRALCYLLRLHYAVLGTD